MQGAPCEAFQLLDPQLLENCFSQPLPQLLTWVPRQGGLLALVVHLCVAGAFLEGRAQGS